MDTKVLAASFKNAQQVIELMQHGVHSVTVPYDICKSMMNHPLTDWSVDKFIEDWENTFGKEVKQIIFSIMVKSSFVQFHKNLYKDENMNFLLIISLLS